MAKLDAQRLELANSVRQSLATENELTTDQARAFVRGLQTSWQVPIIRWDDAESRRQLEDAHRLLHAARILRGIQGTTSPDATVCYRRAAEILEWLARADDPLRTIAPIDLFAAAAYQLGGLPAMSRGLLLQLEAPDRGSKLYGAFLQADFDAVVSTAMSFWVEHSQLTTATGALGVLHEEAGDRVEWFFTVELVRALGLFSHAIRQNDEARRDRALAKLGTLDQMALRTFSADASILISLLQEVAEGFKQASIYNPLQQLGAANPNRLSRLNSYARGQFGRGRGILWRPQIEGLQRLLDSSSFALCTPTGSGKTLVAVMALLKELVIPDTSDGLAPLAIYLVPSRALAGEVEAKLRSELGADLTITGLYGGTDWGITDYWLQSDDPTVLIATVEKADALMRYVGPLIVSRLKLLIVDEAHQVVPDNSERTRRDFADHSSRSLRIESFVSRLLARAPDISRIALTAVAGGASNPVAQWLERSDDAVAVGTHYRSTRQVIGMIEFAPERAGRVEVEIVNGQILFVRGRQAPVYIPLRTRVMPQLPSAMRNSINCYNAVSVLWTALHLIGEERRVLISVADRPERMMKWFRDALALRGWAEVNPFRPPVDDRSAAKFAEAQRACADYCGHDSHEAVLLAQGIATSHGQMPQRVRRLMTDLIDSHICPITVATATLTEGVNLPFDLIFLTSLKRQTFDAQTRQTVFAPLSVSEFQNLAGRAGRPGATKGLEGLTLVAIPAMPSSTAPGARLTQVRQIESLKADYFALLRSLQTDNENPDIHSPLALLMSAIAQQAATLVAFTNEEAFLEWLEQVSPDDLDHTRGQDETGPRARLAGSVDELDAFILTAVEEVRNINGDELSAADIEARLKLIWQSSFARVAARREAWLERALLRRGKGVTERIYPDAEERRRLYQYGFSPQIGRRFAAVAPSIHLLLSQANDYGEQGDEERIAMFVAIGTMIAEDRGFGFRARDNAVERALLQDWQRPLRWWMNIGQEDGPEPNDLRGWQRFVSDNLEFRLGAVIGAVVAQAWSAGADSALDVPSLQDWKSTTELPWFAFWARELLRWGTLEPFIAFAMAQGLAGTRAEAEPLRHEFRRWLTQNQLVAEADDWIDPQKFLTWQRDRRETRPVQPPTRFEVPAQLSTGAELRQPKYSVLPALRRGYVAWIDPAGFELARTDADELHIPLGENPMSSDYELKRERPQRQWHVRQTFRAK
jgi:hypothetical protein